MTYAGTNALLDAPWITPAGLSLLGVPLAQWVVILAFLYGIVRLAMVTTEYYWKWKDRRASESQRDVAPARAGSGSPEGNGQAKDGT